MESGKRRLYDLFYGPRIFKVPNYQRAYAWEKRQLEDFIEDVENQAKSTTGRPYFLGALLLQDGGTTEDGKYKKFFVVDGQQRLTTTVLFISEALKRLRILEAVEEFDEDREAFVEKSERMKFSTVNTDNAFFWDYVIRDSKGKFKFETASQRRLMSAKREFSKYLAKKNVEDISEMLHVIRDTDVLIYVVKDSLDATLIFETTNDRGKHLTDLESLKSFFMHKAYEAAADAATVIEKIEGHFEKMYRQIERLSSQDEDVVLRYFYIAEFQWTDKSQYQETKDSIKRQYNQLLKKGKKQQLISELEASVLKLAEYFDRMGELESKQSKLPALMHFMALGRTAQFLPLLLKAYPASSSDLDRYSRLVRACEVFAFRSAIAGKRADTGVVKFHEIARDWSGNYESLVEAVKDMTEGWNIGPEFESELDSPYIYYKRGAIRYLLWRYENDLRDQNGYPSLQAADFESDDTRLKISIEHIAAQNPEETESSLTQATTYDPKADVDYLHHLGNLAIDPLSSNVKKGNKSFDEKNLKFFRDAPLLSHRELDKIAAKNGGWGVAAIRERAEKIKAFALTEWDPENI